MTSKKTNLTVVGRRNKQQILRDFVRPEPANVISSEPPELTTGTSGDEGRCAGPGGSGQPTGGGAAWAREEDIECERTWSFGGVFTDPSGEIILDNEVPAPAWFTLASRAGVTDGSIVGTMVSMPDMDAVGGLDVVLFGASYNNWQAITAGMVSNCTPSYAEGESAIYGVFTVTGDYISDPWVNYPVFGIGESDGYNTDMKLPGMGAGTYPQLRYYGSGRQVFGTLATEHHAHPITPGWIFDQWVVMTEDDAGNIVFTPTGVSGGAIPYSRVLRTNQDTDVHEEIIQIGDYQLIRSPSSETDMDMDIHVSRTVNWNLGVGASQHREHFAAAYKGAYEELTVSFEGSHRFFPLPNDFEPLASNTRKTLPMENIDTYTWQYPWQDIATVYNVWVDGLFVQPDMWDWNADTTTLTFTYAVPPDAFVLADSTVQ